MLLTNPQKCEYHGYMLRTSAEDKKNIKIPESVHEKVRIQAAINKTTIEKWVEDALLQKLNTNINFNDQAAELRILMNEQRP